MACFHSFDSRYTCNPNISKVENSALQGPISGSHLSGKVNLNVQGLKVVDQKLNGKFPSSIEMFFPNLMIISFINCGLTSISSSDLKPFPSLIALRIDNNNIQSLSNDLFVFNPRIKTFVFQNNQMKRIGAKLVNMFESLNILNLNGNICISGESYNDPEAMRYLLYKVASNCTPTFETIESDLLNSTTFNSNIDNRINIKVAVETNQRQADVAYLKTQISERVTINNFTTVITAISQCLPRCCSIPGF